MFLIFEFIGNALSSAANAISSGIDNFFLSGAAAMLDKAFGMQAMDSVKTWTSFSEGSSVYSIYWDVVNKALDTVKPFGYALITTFFLMYLIDAAAKEQVTVDSLIKVLIQLVIIVAVLSKLNTIINTFLSLSDTLINSFNISDSYADSNVTIDGTEIVADWYAGNEDTAMTILIQSFGIWIIAKLALIAVSFAAISRAIEIGWRCVFAPIGIANCFEGGVNSKGMQYLKTLGVTVLSGAAIYLVTGLGFAITAGFLTDVSNGDFLGALASLLGTAGAAIGVSNKIRDLA